MNWFAKFVLGLQIVGQVIAVALQLQIPGQSVSLPQVHLDIEGNRYGIDVKVTRKP